MNCPCCNYPDCGHEHISAPQPVALKELGWLATAPKEPGWYWWRYKKHGSETWVNEVVQVRAHLGELTMQCVGDETLWTMASALDTAHGVCEFWPTKLEVPCVE